MTVSILLATTGRPDMAEACVRGLLDTTGDHQLEIVVAIDACAETGDRIVGITNDWGGRVHLLLDERDDHRGCSRAWNDALAQSSGDLLVLAADDLVWHPGWLDAALEQMAEFPDGWGMVGFNDGHWGAELSTHYLMSRRFVKEVLGGVVAWDVYRHSFNDAEANERAKRAGRYAWCERARVTHQHWLFGDRQQDATDTRELGEHPACERIFLQRAAAGFPNDHESVI